MVYLAIDYGTEGWKLERYPTAKDALEAVKKGQTYGSPWMILREIEIVPIDAKPEP